MANIYAQQPLCNPPNVKIQGFHLNDINDQMLNYMVESLSSSYEKARSMYWKGLKQITQYEYYDHTCMECPILMPFALRNHFYYRDIPIGCPFYYRLLSVLIKKQYRRKKAEQKVKRPRLL